MAALDKGLSDIRKILTGLVEKSSKIDDILEYIEDEIDNQFEDDEYDGASDEDIPDVLPEEHPRKVMTTPVKIVPKIKTEVVPSQQQPKQQSTVVMSLKQPTGTASMVSTINPSKVNGVPISKKLDAVSFQTEYVQDTANNVRTKVVNFIDTCNLFDHLKNNTEKQNSVALKIANKLSAPYALKGNSLIIAGKYSPDKLKEVFKSLWKPKAN